MLAMKKTFYVFYRPSRIGSHALTAALAIVLTGAPLLADSAGVTVKAPGTTEIHAAETDFAWLEQEARQWVAGQEGLRADAVAFMPLDKRITAGPCAEPLVIDKPFGGNKTLRVRCLSDGWQVFMQRADGGKPQVVSQTQHGRAMVRSESTTSRKPAPAIQSAPTPLMVVVARQNLVAGQALEPDAFVLEKRAIEGNPGTYFLQPDGLEFSELMRDVKAGEPIRQRDLKKAVLVKRNHLVQYNAASTPGLQITVQLQSMDDGRIGDQIRLKNPDSGRILTGLVVGRNLARGL
jgi:flagella basal body P-ring formation protein FlgA